MEIPALCLHLEGRELGFPACVLQSVAKGQGDTRPDMQQVPREPHGKLLKKTPQGSCQRKSPDAGHTAMVKGPGQGKGQGTGGVPGYLLLGPPGVKLEGLGEAVPPLPCARRGTGDQGQEVLASTGSQRLRQEGAGGRRHLLGLSESRRLFSLTDVDPAAYEASKT